MRGALLGFEPSGHDRDDGPPGPFGVLEGWEVLSLKKKNRGLRTRSQQFVSGAAVVAAHASQLNCTTQRRRVLALCYPLLAPVSKTVPRYARRGLNLAQCAPCTLNANHTLAGGPRRRRSSGPALSTPQRLLRPRGGQRAPQIDSHYRSARTRPIATEGAPCAPPPYSHPLNQPHKLHISPQFAHTCESNPWVCGKSVRSSSRRRPLSWLLGRRAGAGIEVFE